ncbi:MAG TPA: cupin domain-containing protein [Chloroflexota bacterium]
MHSSRDELPELLGAAIRGSDWGDLRSTVVSMPAGTDARPLFKGLPDDRCPAPHWGYVIKGQIRIIYPDCEEVLRTGDLYYLPSGHTAIVEEDFESVEFSLPAAHEQVLDVIKRNAAMAQTAPAA